MSITKPKTVAALALLFCAAVTFGIAKENSSNDERQRLPSLAEILETYGKKTSSSEFRELVRRCGLKLYSRSQELRLTGRSPRQPNKYPLETREAFGGSGLVFTASAQDLVDGDLSGAPVLDEPKIVGIRIIVGKCREEEYFGIWKGKLPDIELCLTPEALLAKYPNIDSDVEEVTHPMMTRRRRINYYIQPLENRFPYAFVFVDGSLAYIEIYPRNPPPRIIRPQSPP